MQHLYLFTLEIVPLSIGETYDELPSHLTLMSRFLSDLSTEALATAIRPLFADTAPIHLIFGETIELGPKRVTAHMVNSQDELELHEKLYKMLNTANVHPQYPEFIGDNHRAHITQREGVQFSPGTEYLARAAYLIEVLDKKRVIRAKLKLETV